MSRTTPLISGVVVGLLTTLGSLVLLVILFYALFSLVFESSGHPAMPQAPAWLYWLVFGVLLPVLATVFGVRVGIERFRFLKSPVHRSAGRQP